MAGILELQCQEFKTMTNMLRALMKKVDNMEEQMDKQRHENSKTHKEMLDITNNSMEMQDAANGIIVDWTQLKKESLSLRI